VLVFYARSLTFSFFGWPFSFWVAAQGALVVYCLIIWYYARYMNKLDIEYGVSEGEE
jgi:putative solute:sodium symporter small subunit